MLYARDTEITKNVKKQEIVRIRVNLFRKNFYEVWHTIIAIPRKALLDAVY